MTPTDEAHKDENASFLISLIRDSNPNLRPVGITTEVSKLLTRKKPTAPEPHRKELHYQPEPVDESLNLSDPFWKYHLLYFGDGLYLTTNPTPKHINCQLLPGYYVRRSGNSLNFRLVFEGIESGEQIICVEKRTTKAGASFHYNLCPTRKLVQGKFVEEEVVPELYSGRASRVPFPNHLLPMPLDMPYTNFRYLSDQYGTWNIGSVPMLVPSKISAKTPKYQGKHNIYFHDLFKLPNTLHVGETPEVVAMFRRCESSHRKRLIQSIHRLLAKDTKVYGTEPALDPFAEVKTYVLAGDGLHWDLHPKDDEADHRYKLGWLTIYKDDALLENRGMFDIVVALMVAIAFDQNHGR